MKALLISTYELGHQPLGLAQPLAHLRATGVDARGNDLAVEALDEAAVAAADIVGISAPMHTALRLGVRAAQRVRALNPRAHICFYGLYAGLNAGYLLQTCADSIIGGEVEEPLVQTVLAVAEGRPVEQAATNLGRQRFLVPERSTLPGLESYARLDLAGAYHLAGCVEASRGCAHQCLHCPLTPVYGGRLRIVPAEIVLADVRQLAAAGAEHITFADPDFFNGVRHSLAIVRAMHAEFPHLTFDATIKVEHLLEHRALLSELRELGCVFITSAVESLSDTVLQNLDKGHTAADVETALALARAAGIALRPTLLPFTPWTAIGDYLRLLDFIEDEGLLYAVEPVQLAIRLLVPPGSALLRSSAMRPHLEALDAAAFAWRWRHPDPRMDVLAEQAAALVEGAAGAREEPAVTFARIRALAEQTKSGPSPRTSCPPQAGPNTGRGRNDDSIAVGVQFIAPAAPEPRADVVGRGLAPRRPEPELEAPAEGAGEPPALPGSGAEPEHTLSAAAPVAGAGAMNRAPTDGANPSALLPLAPGVRENRRTGPRAPARVPGLTEAWFC